MGDLALGYCDPILKFASISIFSDNKFMSCLAGLDTTRAKSFSNQISSSISSILLVASQTRTKTLKNSKMLRPGLPKVLYFALNVFNNDSSF